MVVARRKQITLREAYRNPREIFHPYTDCTDDCQLISGVADLEVYFVSERSSAVGRVRFIGGFNLYTVQLNAGRGRMRAMLQEKEEGGKRSAQKDRDDCYRERMP